MNNEQTPALRQAISEMRNMKESYDQIAGAAEAYNVGKVQLAAAISSKGVETSPTESYPEMAEKVNAISQETYQINGGEMYAKQLFGSLETPNYWNLYDVLTQLLSDGRLVQYGGILLAEYYRGYDSLALAGAGAGGAYVVSDKDENGQFKMYTEDTTHTWDTEFDGKGNRWVAYCFADEYHDFQIMNTNTSPRSIFIGRKVGTITNLVNGRTSKVVVPDGNLLKCLDTKGYSNAWDKNIVLKNVQNWDSQSATGTLFNGISADSLYIQIGNITQRYRSVGSLIQNGSIGSIIIKANAITVSGNGGILIQGENITYPFIVFDATEINFGLIYDMPVHGKVRDLVIIAEKVNGVNFASSITNSIYLRYKTNDKSKSFAVRSENASNATSLILQDGWCKNLTIGNINNLTEANMYAYILQRLKQDEPDCGDGVTITLGSTNLAKLTSEESVQLLDDLTNIYGYTFA